MNTVVWIMAMFSYGANVNTGPEFSTKEKCEAAAAAVAQSANDKLSIGSVRTPWCVRIEK